MQGLKCTKMVTQTLRVNQTVTDEPTLCWERLRVGCLGQKGNLFCSFLSVFYIVKKISWEKKDSTTFGSSLQSLTREICLKVLNLTQNSLLITAWVDFNRLNKNILIHFKIFKPSFQIDNFLWHMKGFLFFPTERHLKSSRMKTATDNTANEML